MEYSNDLNEIIALIHATVEGDVSEDPRFCITQLAQQINDEYLMSRAACMENAFQHDTIFYSAVSKLAVQCNENHKDCSGCPVKKYCNAYIHTAQSTWPQDAPRMIDLFCGAGGLSLGFTQEGFITALATRSLETAARGGTPKKSTRIGVISAPPPMPVRPTITPTPKPAAIMTPSTGRVCRPADQSPTGPGG